MTISELIRRQGASRGLAALRRNWFVALLAATFLVTILALAGAIRATAQASPEYAEAPNAWARLADGGGPHASPELVGSAIPAEAVPHHKSPLVSSSGVDEFENEEQVPPQFTVREQVDSLHGAARVDRTLGTGGP